MKVSVVLPIYNGEKTLERTLKSLSNQTFIDFEIIACIDGSNDNSIEILKDFQKTIVQKITILVNERNLGLGPTMNRLVANSSCEYIAIAEQDDVYLPNRLEIQVKTLGENPDFGMCSGIAEHFDFDKNKTSFSFPGILVNNNQYPENNVNFFLMNYLYGVKVANSCMMFRKSVHIDNGLYFSKHLGSVSVDWLYVLRFLKVSKIIGINQTLVQLDRTPNRENVTNNKIKMFKSSFELLRLMQFEEPEIITKTIYNKALTHQNRMKFGHLNLFQKWVNIFSFPLDVKFKMNYLVKLVVRKIKK